MAQKVQLRKQQCKDVPSVFYWYKKSNIGNNNNARASRPFFIGTKKEIWETTTNQGRPARFSLVQKKKFGKQQQIKGVPLVFHWYKKKCNYYGRDALTFIRIVLSCNNLF